MIAFVGSSSNSFYLFFHGNITRLIQRLYITKCYPVLDFVQELEDTISSLRQQVSVLQQRAALLKEDLALRSLPHLGQTHTQIS